MNHLQQRRRQEEKTRSVQLPTGEDEDKGVGTVWKNVAQARRVLRTSQSSGPPAAAAAAASHAPGNGARPGSDVITASGKRLTMTKPRSQMSDVEKSEMRHSMYQNQVIDGIFEAGPRAKYDAAHFKQQSECRHRYEDLKWGSNGTTVYAKCKACELKSVVHYTVVNTENDGKPKTSVMRQTPKVEDPLTKADP